MATSTRGTRRPQLSESDSSPTDEQILEAVRRSDSLELLTPGEFASLLDSLDLSDFEPRWTLTEGGDA